MHLLMSRRTFARLCALVLTIGAALSGQTALATEDSGVAARNKQLVTEAFDGWRKGGTTFFTDILASDVTWKIEGSGPNAATYFGRDQLMERAVRPLASRLSEPNRPTSMRIWADGDHVIINWEGSARARDGLPYNNRYLWIFRMKDGKAVEVTAFLDLALFDDVLRRIPLLPPG